LIIHLRPRGIERVNSKLPEGFHVTEDHVKGISLVNFIWMAQITIMMSHKNESKFQVCCHLEEQSNLKFNEVESSLSIILSWEWIWIWVINMCHTYDLFGMSHNLSILKMESFAVFIQFSKLKIILVLHIYFFIVSTMDISCR